MKKLLTCAFAALTLSAAAQTADMFQPYKSTDLRLPAVPVFVTDPYISFWSPYDTLTEGSIRHWTGEEKPLQGFVRVDGKVYRFMGQSASVYDAVASLAKESGWTGKMTRKTPPADWTKPEFDDSAWETVTAPIGSDATCHTQWTDFDSDIYVRRVIDITPEQLACDMQLRMSHDDGMKLYINGTQAFDTGDTYIMNQKEPMTPDIKKLLKPGRNVIAATCHNGVGGAYLDFGIYSRLDNDIPAVEMARQTQCDVMATSSYYTFTAGPVELKVVFTAPMLIDDYDLLSSPINYISYNVVSTDGRPHDVQVLLTASPMIAQDSSWQPTRSTVETTDGITYVRTGTVEQPVLDKKGDHVCIDWGYLYMPAINGQVALSSESDILHTFYASGKLPAGKQEIVARTASEMPALAYIHNFGKVTDASSFAMLGYDEIYDVEYLYKPYKGYWAHNGQVSILDMFKRMSASYASIMNRCKALDKTIYDDGDKVGGKKYAESLAACYRLVIAAHKLFRDDEDNLLFFSKENDSNGSVNTVDLTYPEAPLFLLYNPELQKAMMTSILDYAKSGRWTNKFAAHDMGTYPIANGQTYGGELNRNNEATNMPVEESGNMLVLLSMLSDIDGNTSYVDPYWDIVTEWADYLVAKGLDPATQLCTDDFAGHWAHNVNLAAKAIMGIAGYARMADMRGDKTTADKYMAIARDYGKKWEEMARDGDHYRLAYDRPGTWSMKYNMIWDKIWDTGIFPNKAMQKEAKFYLGKQNRYGMPLDCRKDYTKSDWYMWSAAMTDTPRDFQVFVDHLYDYINETPSRCPLSDWYYTTDGRKQAFIGRSVIGGHWMPVLVNRYRPFPASVAKARK